MNKKKIAGIILSGVMFFGLNTIFNNATVYTSNVATGSVNIASGSVNLNKTQTQVLNEIIEKKLEIKVFL